MFFLLTSRPRMSSVETAHSRIYDIPATNNAILIFLSVNVCFKMATIWAVDRSYVNSTQEANIIERKNINEINNNLSHRSITEFHTINLLYIRFTFGSSIHSFSHSASSYFVELHLVILNNLSLITLYINEHPYCRFGLNNLTLNTVGE